MSRFFSTLESRESTKHLVAVVSDPENPGQTIQEFFRLVRGPKQPGKKKLFGECLLRFSTVLIKQDFLVTDDMTEADFAEAQYQPGVVAKMLRQLMAAFRQYNVQYSLSKEFNGVGKVQAYWKDTWIETLKHRPTFGTKPNASTFDPDGKEKRIAKISIQPMKRVTFLTRTGDSGQRTILNYFYTLLETLSNRIT